MSTSNYLKIVYFILGCVISFGFWPQGLAEAAAADKPQASNSLNTSGYVDVQYQWGRGAVELTGLHVAPGESNSFTVYQGAMVLSDSLGKAEVLIDIPFRQSTQNPDQTNDLELGTQQAQAYIHYNLPNSKSFLKLGQFDSFYGLEANDSSEIFFPRVGIVYDMTPGTHTGFLYGWGDRNFTTQLVISNANQVGQQRSDERHELGAQAAWQADNYTLSLAALYIGHRGKYTLVTTSDRSLQDKFLLEIVSEVQVAKLRVGAELNMVRPPYDQAKASSASNEIKNTTFVYGALVQALYDINDTWAFGVRYEFTKNDDSNEFVRLIYQANTAAGQTPTGFGGHYSKLTLGLKRTLGDQLIAKGGVEMASIDAGSDIGSRTRGFTTCAIGMIYSF